MREALLFFYHRRV